MKFEKMKKVKTFVSKILRGIWLNIGRAYKEMKKLLWGHRQGIQMFTPLLTLVVSLAAIWISYHALQQSRKSGSTMIAQMDTLSTLFTKVNEQISYLPTSVGRFDSTVRGLNEGISKQQQEFQKSISGLQRNVDSFSKGIADYGRILAKIVEASDKQLALLDERQKLLEKELMRRPKLKLGVKECDKDTLGRLSIMPQITNEGDEIALNCKIVIAVPAEFHFESSGFVVWESTARVQAWSYEVNTFIPYRGERIFTPSLSNEKMKFSIKILPDVKFPYKLQYILYHDKGADMDTLVINLPK